MPGGANLGEMMEKVVKHIFLIGVIVYSVASMVLQHWPAAVNYTGMAALPWMVLMVVDLGFAATAGIKLVGPALFASDDEEENILDVEDLNVPDGWFYGLFGLNLLGNVGWHGYMFATETGAASFGFSIWFIVEVVAIALTFLFFKHAQKVARVKARKSATISRVA